MDVEQSVSCDALFYNFRKEPLVISSYKGAQATKLLTILICHLLIFEASGLAINCIVLCRLVVKVYVNYTPYHRKMHTL